MKKIAGDIITLHKYTKIYNHMRYSSWDTEWDRQILKKWQKHLEMSSFYTGVPKITIIYMLPEIWNTTNSFLSFLAIFCLFTPLLTPKIKIWDKRKKPWRYHPITHVYHKWRSWCIGTTKGTRNRVKAQQSFLSFWAIFSLLTLLTTWKIKVLKKWKKHLKILSFYTCIPQMMIKWCMVPEIWSTTDKIFCHFELFFALLPH